MSIRERRLVSPVRVRMRVGGRAPESFVWRGRAYRVSAVQELWRMVGDWWDGEGEKTFFRVLCAGGGVFELCYDHLLRSWRLERVVD